MNTMKAVVFHGVNDIRVEEVPKPRPKAGEAVIRISATTICGTDVHIVRGEYPVRPGLILGHEPVGVIEELGEGLEQDYTVGQRVIVGAITPCGQCFYCFNGAHSQCHGPLGGWRFGNTINGAWAEYLLVPDARANLALVPDQLSDDEVLMLPDIASTGIAGAESGKVRIGDSVAVFAQGPIGLCATLGARLRGAGLIIGVDPLAARRSMARAFGAGITLDPTAGDVVAEIKRLTDGRGVDVAIEALGRQETFEAALRSVRPGGILSSLGVYSGKLIAPYEAVYRGPWRPADRDDAVPWREGAHAQADGDGAARPHRPDVAHHAQVHTRAAARGVRVVQPPGQGCHESRDLPDRHSRGPETAVGDGRCSVLKPATSAHRSCRRQGEPP